MSIAPKKALRVAKLRAWREAKDLLDDVGLGSAVWRDASLSAVVADLEGGEVMPDPMVLNDLAGWAILNGKHVVAAKYLQAAAELAETVEAKRVLIERAQEQANIAWKERYGSLPEAS